ncbi:hypothetical protein MSAN_01509800 [Mycena sanguinolenta]|uniref:Uncharacterized protein n=1 Tax=Mycena sanguinolenta TaxID=230812 RepID=A0A8H6Y333_9AGAR|nr:hypothetical protein MSAN_01509800 [Mycena sanguinolenta]
MDTRADPDGEFIVVSTSDYAESASYPNAVFPQASRLASNAKLLVKSFSFLSSRLGARVAEVGTAGTHTRKYPETKPGRQAIEHTVNKYYNYHITGGFGGPGGEGGDQGGDGGTGQGPTVYFGQPEAREPSEFQTIRLGDLKLVKEVRFDLQSGVVGRQSRAEAANYISDVFPSMDYHDLPVWIRPSTGELCLDLHQGGPETGPVLYKSSLNMLRLENVTLDAPDSEDIIISSLSEDQYHEICCLYPFSHDEWFQVSTEHAVGLGIFGSDSQHGTWARIAKSLVLPEEELHWNWDQDGAGELLPNSWIRYNSHATCALELELRLSSYKMQTAWLAQANRIFVELEEDAHIGDYVCIGYVGFSLRITDERDIPDGYLFVCPPRDFRTTCTEAYANLYQWPACPAYWSLDPSGADRLSTEDARILGFPTIHIETLMIGKSWDQSIYEGLRRFHESKGFNPESREVARRLGYPLYEVLSDRVPFPAREGHIHGGVSRMIPHFVDRWAITFDLLLE